MQQEEWLGGSLGGDAPLCTLLSNNHNFHFTGKWYDETCTESGYGFVCQKAQGQMSPSLFLKCANLSEYMTARLYISVCLSDCLSFIFQVSCCYLSLCI